MAEKTYKDERGEFIFRRKNGKIIKIYVKEAKEVDHGYEVITFEMPEVDPGVSAKSLEGDHFKTESKRWKDTFGIEPKKMTFKEADSNHVNPLFGIWGYNTNCQTAVVAFEYRMRGYDIHSQPRDNHPLSPQSEVAIHPLHFWRDENGEMPVNLLYDERLSENDISKKIVEEMNNEIRNGGDFREKLKELKKKYKYSPIKLLETMMDKIEVGARYCFSFSWDNKSGHIVCAMKDDDGKLFIYDPQSAEVVKEDDLLGYFEQIAFSLKSKRPSLTNKSGYESVTFPAGLSLFRVDNAEFVLPSRSTLNSFFYKTKD